MDRGGEPLTAVDECPVAVVGQQCGPTKQWSTEHQLHLAQKGTGGWPGGQTGQWEKAGPKDPAGHLRLRQGQENRHNSVAGKDRPAFPGGMFLAWKWMSSSKSMPVSLFSGPDPECKPQHVFILQTFSCSSLPAFTNTVSSNPGLLLVSSEHALTWQRS